MKSRHIVNAISLSRIPLSFVFVLCFQPKTVLFFLSFASVAAAIFTDLLDGWVARRLRVASIEGRLWDSLGDKSMYIAVIIAYNTQGFLSPLLCWGLLVREVALYITRVLYIEKLPMVERIRPFTNWHGYFMHVVILLGLAAMYGRVTSSPLNVTFYMQVAGWLALLSGVGSIVHWLMLTS